MSQVERTGGLRQLFRLLPSRRRRQLGFVILVMLVGAVAELVTIGAVLPFLQLLIDPEPIMTMPELAGVRRMFGWNEPADFILPAVILLISAAAASTAFRLVLTWITQKYVFQIGHDVDMHIYDRTIRQSYGDYVRRNSSEILSAFEKANHVTMWVLQPAMQAATSGVIALLIIALLFVLDPVTATGAALGMGLLYLSISLGARGVLRHISERWAYVTTARTKTVQETLGGLRDIILDRSHPVFERKFGAINKEFRNLSVKANFLAASPRFVVEGGGIALIGLLAFYYSKQPGGAVQAIPTLGALALGAQRLIPLVQAVYLGWTNYSSARYAIGDVLALMTAPVLDRDRGDRQATPQPFRDAIEFKDVNFSYSGDALAVRNIDLTIEKGQRVGFIGKTGSGKSTLVDLLMGLIEPTSGQILIDGEVRTSDNVRQWQAQVAHVPQMIYLADDTIAANIAFGEDPGEIDQSRVEDAALRADIHAFIADLPDGYRTTVGERGIRLSGGQRQRIGIARALYKRATVLVLDEATSALDDATEAAIMDSIEKLNRDLTLILIAHRLSTLSSCDVVCRLQGGTLVEQGSYEDVVGGHRMADHERHADQGTPQT